MNRTSPPNRELVVYALFLLGGDLKPVHTEDIALKCHELFPGSFSWVKHPEYPDKDVVRVALTDARKDHYGALVEGRAGQKRGLSAKTKRDPIPDGWTLTSRGIAWVQSKREELELLAGTGRVKEHRQQLLRQLKRIKDHPLYAQFLDSPDRFAPAIGQIADLLRCRVDAEPQIWRKRFESVQRQAESAEQPEVLRFIRMCQEAYTQQR
jgi:hypothetical protein